MLKIVKYKKMFCQKENFQCILLVKFKIQFLQRINGFFYSQSLLTEKKTQLQHGLLFSFIGIEVIEIFRPL